MMSDASGGFTPWRPRVFYRGELPRSETAQVPRRSPADLQRRKKAISLVFVAATSVLVVSFVFMFQAGQVSYVAVQRMTRERLVLERLEGILFSLTDAETGERGYLLTGEAAYLEPYRKATREIGSKLANLRAMALDGSLSLSQVERVARLANEKLSGLKEAIEVRQERGADAGIALVRNGAGKQVMDELRLELGQMQTAAQAAFADDASRAHRARVARTAMYVLAGLLNLGFLVWASQKIRSQMHQMGEESELLERTVEERTAKLREMIAELEQVSYAIVHDMRAPLRAMQAFAYLLETEIIEGRPGERVEHARRIKTAASRLDRLIQGVLMYNQAVLRDLPLKPVDLSKLLPDLIETYPNLDATKAEIRIESSLPTIMGDEALLAQCFSNLLGNAVKFVAPGVRPQVSVRAEVRDHSARIWVEDNGIGIPAQAQTRLFGLFQRLSSEQGVTGVGLAIVRKVTERMGGKVGAESVLGKGSRFWVELQLARP